MKRSFLHWSTTWRNKSSRRTKRKTRKRRKYWQTQRCGQSTTTTVSYSTARKWSNWKNSTFSKKTATCTQNYPATKSNTCKTSPTPSSPITICQTTGISLIKRPYSWTSRLTTKPEKKTHLSTSRWRSILRRRGTRSLIISWLSTIRGKTKLSSKKRTRRPTQTIRSSTGSNPSAATHGSWNRAKTPTEATALSSSKPSKKSTTLSTRHNKVAKASPAPISSKNTSSLSCTKSENSTSGHTSWSHP